MEMVINLNTTGKGNNKQYFFLLLNGFNGIRNKILGSKYSICTCFQYAFVQLSLVDMLRSYHAPLCISLYFFNIKCNENGHILFH